MGVGVSVGVGDTIPVTCYMLCCLENNQSHIH